MCYYVQKIYFHEIIKMKCHFFKDENNTIWFHHASDIWARHNKAAQKAFTVDVDNIKRKNKEELEEKNK